MQSSLEPSRVGIIILFIFNVANKAQKDKAIAQDHTEREM